MEYNKFSMQKYNDDFSEWRMYISEALDRIDRDISEIKKDINKDRVENTREVTKIKTMAAIYGSIGGFVISAIVLFLSWVMYDTLKEEMFDEPQHIIEEQQDTKR